MKKKILLFFITILVLSLGITVLIGPVIAGNANGKNKATFWAAGEAFTDFSDFERVWTSPKWETPVYPPTYGDPEVVHYRGMTGEFGIGDTLVVKIDGVELESEITCLMLMDVEIHKPVFPYPAGPFSCDFFKFRTTKTYTFEGLSVDDTLVCEISYWSYPDEPSHGTFHGYGTGYFKGVIITEGVAYSDPGLGMRVDEAIIMGWPGLP